MNDSHKDLPTGSRGWASSVDSAMQEVERLRLIVQRMATDFGLDYSNPDRGRNLGNMPNVENPVQLKLPSLKDLDIRDAQDGDLLTFDGKRGVWVARRHDTVQLPKVFERGDPASYYPAYILADTWSVPKTRTNFVSDPRFNMGIGGWAWREEFNNSQTSALVSRLSSGGRTGGGAMEVVFRNDGQIHGGTTSTGAQGSWVAIQHYGWPTTNLHTQEVWIKTDQTGVGITVSTAFKNSNGGLDWQSDGVRVLQPGEWTRFIHPVWANGIEYQYNQTSISVSVLAVGDSATIVVDDHMLTDGRLQNRDTANLGFFTGSSPDNANWTFDWEGGVDQSASTATSVRRFACPSIAPQGSTIQVVGASYLAGEMVKIGVGSRVLGEVYVNQDGTFDTLVGVPADAWVGTDSFWADSQTPGAVSPNYIQFTVTAG